MNKNNSWSAGIRIAERRRSLHMTQKIFCKKIGISQTSLYQIERHDAIPRYETLVKIVDILGVDLNWLNQALNNKTEEGELADLSKMPHWELFAIVFDSLKELNIGMTKLWEVEENRVLCTGCKGDFPRDLIAKHIRQCNKHPLGKLKTALAEIRNYEDDGVRVEAYDNLVDGEDG